LEQQLFSEIWRNPKAWSTENQKESKKTNRSKHYTESKTESNTESKLLENPPSILLWMFSK
jgi:hypothetical protein